MSKVVRSGVMRSRLGLALLLGGLMLMVASGSVGNGWVVLAAGIVLALGGVVLQRGRAGILPGRGEG